MHVERYCSNMELFRNTNQLPEMVTCKEFLQAEIYTVLLCAPKDFIHYFLCKNAVIIIGF